MQLTVSLYLLGLAVAQLVFGPLSDRFGRRPVVLAGLALASVASTAAIFAAGIAGLIIARAVQSLGASTGQTIGRAIIRDLYDREQRRLHDRAGDLGRGADADGGAADRRHPRHLVRLAGDLRVRRVLSFAVFVLGGAGAAGDPYRSRARRASAAICWPTCARSARSPRFFGYALCAGLGSAPFFTFLGGAPYVVVGMLGRTSAEYGLWFFLPSIGFMAGNFAVSRLTGRSPSTP